MRTDTHGYFGVMLDVSRNAVMSVDGLKRFICVLEKLGYNCLQLYMEDTYEIAEEPLFGHLRGRYTKQELREIDEFAKNHSIELMPCIQTLAHLNQLFKFPKYNEVKDIADILLVGEEKTYTLIERMFKNLAGAFSTRKIHIGMDEAHFLGLGKYLDRNGYRERFDILLEHLNRVCEIAEKYGFEPIMWSDMFFRIAFKGNYYQKSGVIPDEVKKRVPKNIELAYWEYDSKEKEVYDEMLEHHFSFNRETWLYGGAWKWGGFHSGNAHAFPAIQTAVKACQEKSVKHFMITLWGDDGNETPAYAVLPALTYAAECYKGNFEIENAKKTFEALFQEHWDDFLLFDLPMSNGIAKHPVVKEIVSGAKEWLYNDYFLGKLDSALSGDGKEREGYAELAVKLKKAISRSGVYKYVFRSYYHLCKLMEIKCDLGYRTRIAYQKRDKETLKELLKDYQSVLKRLRSFQKAFREMWVTDNKPHGFDVQEIRLGGVEARTKSCLGRIASFVYGRTEKIEELEEKIVDYFTGGEPQRQMMICNSYALLASINIL